MIKKTIALAALATVAATGAAEAQSRDQIRIVGSSTVYPFATVVAENFGKTTDFPTPVIESTGSGGGLKLFCAGVGTGHPDITNASRRIKASELEMCQNNGVSEVTEVRIGYDGIVVANAKDAPEFSVTREELWKALAKQVPQDGALVDNPYKSWSDINGDLPNEPIEVLGPPPTSGTRDAFVELVMEEGCEGPLEGLNLSKDEHKATCATMREDGAFIEAGENDNLIVQKLQANSHALGIFGYSFLDQNGDVIKGAAIEGEQPTFDNIASGAYPVSRPLFFYVKNAHVGTIPGMEDYLAEFTSARAWGNDGYLADRGLIPMSDDEREMFRKQAAELTPLTANDLKSASN